jgi:hypothetical protein
VGGEKAQKAYYSAKDAEEEGLDWKEEAIS